MVRMHELFQHCEMAEMFSHMNVSVFAITTPKKIVDRITLSDPEPEDINVSEAVIIQQERTFLSKILAASVDFHPTWLGGIYTSILNTLLANPQCQKYGINSKTFPHNPEDVDNMNSLGYAIFDLHEHITEMDTTCMMSFIIHVDIGNTERRLHSVKSLVHSVSGFWTCIHSLLEVKYRGIERLNRCPRVYFIFTGTGLDRLPWSFSGSLPTDMIFFVRLLINKHSVSKMPHELRFGEYIVLHLETPRQIFLVLQ